MKDKESSWLSYVNLSDEYERKARFLPGLLSILVLVPGLAAYGVAYSEGLGFILSGVGVWAVLSVFISHLASAFGNRMQRKFWPRWPHDSPTSQFLHPHNGLRSAQQKSIWYAAIKRLTEIDIELAIQQADSQGIEATINDAITRLRYRLVKTPHAERLKVHNADYGFARNLTGLRPVWLTFSAVSSFVCWLAYLRIAGRLDLCIFSSTILIAAPYLATIVLPAYVRDKANHYAESFFGAMMELDQEEKIMDGYGGPLK